MALSRTGSPENVLILRRGADSELSSGVPRDAISILSAFPHVATSADGRPMLSPETYLIITFRGRVRLDRLRRRHLPAVGRQRGGAPV